MTTHIESFDIELQEWGLPVYFTHGFSDAVTNALRSFS